MKILLKRYSFYDSKYRTGDELKDIKKKLKNFKKKINILFIYELI